MKTSTKAYVLMYAATALAMIGVFSKPLGLPANSDGVVILPAGILMWIGYRLIRKPKVEGQIPVFSESQKQKRFWLLASACGVACALGPFWLRIAGATLPFWKLVTISIASFIVCIGAIWLGLKTNGK